jgi:hypothetical protein
MARLLTLVMCVASCAACSPVEKYQTLNEPVGVVRTAGIGDTVIRVNNQHDLPNVFGKADLFGRRSDIGFSEIRFGGID